MANARRHRDASLPRQADELARLKIIQGPDAGVVFVLTGPNAIMGRGDENDIVVTDLKTSRKHLAVSQAGPNWMLQDLGSANGVTHNGKNVRSAVLKTGDVVQLGETLFEFLRGDTATVMLTAPARTAEQIHAEQAAFDAQRARVREMAGVKTKGSANESTRTALLRAKPLPAAPLDPAAAAQQKKKILIYAVVGLGVYFMMFEEEPAKVPTRLPAKKLERNLSAFIPPSETAAPAAGKADMFFKDGFREYTAKNYLRARIQFETALQVYPGHPLAKMYLEKADQAIEGNIQSHLRSGKKALEFGRYRQAKSHFEAVLRSLHRDPGNSAYKEAENALRETLTKMKGDG